MIAKGDQASMGMNEMTTQEESRKLREEGNALYKSGNVMQAVPKYRQAAKITPHDPAPLGNISAALVEIGKYENAIAFAERAIKLHKLKLADAESVVKEQEQIKKLEERVNRAKGLCRVVENGEERKTRMKIFGELGRYRETLHSGLECFHVGHDDAYTMWDAPTENILEKWTAKMKEEESGVDVDEKAIAKRELISFLFVGIGDARNMLRTIIGIAEVEKTKTKKYHFTINDINKCALTRDLVVFMLLEDLSQLDPESEEHTEVLTTIYFIYLAPMIPRFVFERMQQTIDKALSALQSGSQPSKFFYLSKQHFLEYIKVLISWKGSAQTLISPKTVIQAGTRQVSGIHSMGEDISGVSLKCKAERELYLASLVLQPPTSLLEKYDPVMLELLQKYQSRPRANAPRFRDHLCNHWHINTTMIDEDWYHSMQDKRDMGFGHDPFEATKKFTDDVLVVKNPERLYDYMVPFFTEMAKALVILNGRLEIEVVLGDCVDLAERLRFGLFPTTEEFKSENGEDSDFEQRPERFPTSFHRIHLSNVPDYLNGNFSSCLYFAPLLADVPWSVFMSTSLRNGGTWKSIEAFLAEYQCITSESQLMQLTNVAIVDKGPDDSLALPHPMSQMFGPDMAGLMHGMPMAGYISYTYVGHKPQPFQRLLAKKPFMKWIYAQFFRLVLPFNVDISFVSGIIFSPLNITTFFHLLIQLRSLGYPSHWLSEALTNILTNKVLTTCRPPRATPTSPQAITRTHREKHLNTTPFIAELSVLTQIFSPILPFLLTTPLPSPSTIKKYTLTLPPSNLTTDPHALSAHLVLVFFAHAHIPKATAYHHVSNFRPLLDPSWGEVDTDFATKENEALREKGCVVYSSFEVQKKEGGEGEVRAWIEEGRMAAMMGDGWVWALYRVDTWSPVGMGGDVEGCVEEGGSWEGVV
ncbi:hypothetical protein HYALB_00006913 [Hymenoscyphus albidus]|uniref:DUF4470 domain-containing protein n=1 Tax=Hymenoscyphus albidus TaxID=595503 RepID=A0A9N9LFF6_9HELO|nr:hypothetical protein HYALB_00006913 [Hymenoscyphus albidus]